MELDNPKKAEGMKKVPFYFVPPRIIARLALAMYEGVKYGAYNFRVAGKIDCSTYYSATMRHLTDYMEGNDVDKQSPGKLHNLEKAMACITVWLDSIYAGTYNDDRPPRGKSYSTWLDEANATTVLITELTPNKKDAFTQLKSKRPVTKYDVYEIIAHGDPAHREWLRNKLEEVYGE